MRSVICLFRIFGDKEGGDMKCETTTSKCGILKINDTILYYTILYYTILYYTILYYTILYYTILYYTIQY